MTAPAPLFARRDGAVLDFPDLTAAVDDGRERLATEEDFIPMPPGTLLLTLPGRDAICYDRGARTVLPDAAGEIADAVAVALPLGYTRTLLPAFERRAGAPTLPLYGYAAAAWDGATIVVAAKHTDALETWSARSHEPNAVRAGIAARTSEFGAGLLLRQLTRCATEYGCYTAQNMFLRAGEAAIPVSPACNARCIGCISEQEPGAGIVSAQERVRALPTEHEIVDLAVAHLDGGGSMVSFGQGCEGEPLLAAPRIAAAVAAIRKRTSAGVIHCNTNASSPSALARIVDAGVRSIRVSLNSCRPDVYAAYYRPRGYDFGHVLASLQVASDAGAAISLNLLTHPGITDAESEMRSFGEILLKFPIDMVQTRTLNVDPETYFAAVGRPPHATIGMRAWFDWLTREFPGVRTGNFTRGFG
ncbi:MAG TPA: radical SAM protein [Candidatus Eremiobacteraceae bacterium]|nr:radical SAM protein [Candidatus Eremiobacteraceae bacterium]